MIGLGVEVAPSMGESMTTTRSALSDADVRMLVRGATEDERAAAAHKLCRRIDAGLDESEKEAGAEVLRLMAADATELVRRALAVTLKSSPNLPHDVALKLAADIDSIAVPILYHSPVFDDNDLAEIVRTMGAMKQTAISKRTTLSETVTTAIAKFGCEDAVRTACANDNAMFGEGGLKAAVDRFAESEGVTTAIAFRKMLPLSISERLVDLVSDSVRQHLVDHHALSPQTALKIAVGTRERATVDLVDQAGRAADLAAFCNHLNRAGRLSSSLLLRAVAHGHMAFFEWSLAELSGVPHHRTWLMVHDAGALGLKAIYERANLPQRMFQAFRVAVDTYHELQADGVAIDTNSFQEHMLQRFLTTPSPTHREDLDYLLERLDRIGRRPEELIGRVPGRAA